MKISNSLLFIEFLLGFLLIVIIVIARIILAEKRENSSQIRELKKIFSFKPLIDLFILGLKDVGFWNKLLYFFLSLVGISSLISIIILFLIDSRFS